MTSADQHIAIISDNRAILEMAYPILQSKVPSTCSVTYGCSAGSDGVIAFLAKNNIEAQIVDVKNDIEELGRFDMLLSIHCKQIFPEALIRATKCINLHPGYNPYNRGWYPHIFSMINGLPTGATLHEMDEKIDHGKIIGQQQIEIEETDISSDVYQKVLHAEMEVLSEHLESIVHGDYETIAPDGGGNINYKKDFESLCEIDLGEVGTWRDHLKILKALSFDGVFNAYFKDENGEKVYLRLEVDKKG